MRYFLAERQHLNHNVDISYEVRDEWATNEGVGSCHLKTCSGSSL
jgi:hypothetical protein